MTDNFDIIKDFLTPKEIIVEEVNPNHSKIILEPLERGFGHTLGNALRRIILSSIPGSCVVEAKIDGVLHEFSTIDGVAEDVINILLNLKGIAVRMMDVEEAELSVEKSGTGKLTAGDFWVKNKDGYFLKYKKRGQGIHLKNKKRLRIHLPFRLLLFDFL